MQVKIASQQLAEMLKSAGLSTSFTDIRVTSCYSADARTPNSFEPADLAASKAAGTKLVDGMPVLALPFAQRLSQELGKLGYTSPSVAGYHGPGQVYARVNGIHTANRQPGTNNLFRSSTVRARFGLEPAVLQPTLVPTAKSDPPS